MKDKDLDDAFKSFWKETSFKKPGYSKPIQTANSRKTREPRVERIRRAYYPQKRIQVRTLPTQRQQQEYTDYHSQKTRSINQQADYLLAQKRLYNARTVARESGYRSPREKVFEYGKVAGQKTSGGLGKIAGKLKDASKGSDWKEKLRLLRGKSIYD